MTMLADIPDFHAFTLEVKDWLDLNRKRFGLFSIKSPDFSDALCEHPLFAPLALYYASTNKDYSDAYKYFKRHASKFGIPTSAFRNEADAEYYFIEHGLIHDSGKDEVRYIPERIKIGPFEDRKEDVHTMYFFYKDKENLLRYRTFSASSMHALKPFDNNEAEDYVLIGLGGVVQESRLRYWDTSDLTILEVAIKSMTYSCVKGLYNLFCSKMMDEDYITRLSERSPAEFQLVFEYISRWDTRKIDYLYEFLEKRYGADKEEYQTLHTLGMLDSGFNFSSVRDTLIGLRVPEEQDLALPELEMNL